MKEKHLNPAPTLSRTAAAMSNTAGRDWLEPFFDWVDAFRRGEAGTESFDGESRLPPTLRALLAATTEALCREAGRAAPAWTQKVLPLPRPWFVSGMESLKASALVESPVFFRRRNIFVLGNFLSRM